MKSFIKLSMAIICSAIIFSACKNKSNDIGKMIPKNALIIVHMNAKSLSSKLSWDEIKQTTWYNHLYNDSSKPAWTKALMDDPQKSGIDMNSDLIFFALKNMENTDLVFEGNVKDSKAFADLIKNIHPDAVISKDGDLNIVSMDKGTVAWNDKKFAMVTNFAEHFNMHGMNDSAMTDSVKAAPPLVAPSNNLLSVCKSLFSLTSDSSMEKNERFGDLIKEDGDIHYWQNTEELVKSSMSAGMGMIGMLKLDVFYKENVSTITASFDNGKINFKQRMYAAKEFTDVLKKMNNADFNTDMIKNIPGQNLAVVFAWHFNPEGLMDLIKLTGMDGFINMFLVQKGISLDDIIKATKGDVVFALSDLKMQKDSTGADTINGMQHKEMPQHTFLFSTSIGDKDAFNKVLTVVKTLDKNTGHVSEQNYKSSNKYFVAGNSLAAMNSFLAENKTEHAFLDKIKGHPAGGYADVQMIFNAFRDSFTKDSAAKALYDINVKMWDNGLFYGGEYKDGGFTGSAEINLIDKNTNSLKQLNKYADAMSQIIIEEKKKHPGGWMKDSSAVMHTDTSLHKNTHKPSTK